MGKPNKRTADYDFASQDIIHYKNPCTLVTALQESLIDSPTSKPTNRLLLTRTDMRCLHGEPYRRLKRLLGPQSLLEFFIIVGAFLLVTSMTNVQSKPTQTLSPQRKIQYDWDKPIIDPIGESGYAGLNVTIFGKRTIAMCLDTGAGGFSYVNADLVPPDWERLELPHPMIASGIGGNSAPITHTCLLQITLPNGKHHHVTSYIMANLDAGVLLGIGVMKKLRVKFDLPNGIVWIARGNYPITYLNGFRLVDSTKPAVQPGNFRLQPKSRVKRFYSALVESITGRTASNNNKRTPNTFTANFLILKPQNSTLYLPQIA